jgi:lipoprotein-anchoring transpeptidase ErfK/SrfK
MGAPRSGVSRAVVLAVGLICLVACSSAQAPGRGTWAGSSAAPSSSPTKTAKPKPAARITITPKNKQSGVGPRSKVTVRVAHGTLSRVTVTDRHGHKLVGVGTRTATVWTTRGNLAYKAVYTVRAAAKDAHGLQTQAVSTFHSAWPRAQVFPAISPIGARTVGVGMPVVVYFKHPVADPTKVEQHMSVGASPKQAGAWHWFDDYREAHWRPKTYWKAHSRVTVKANLFGVDLGAGYWGKTNRTVIFHIGDSHISIANSITHKMRVYKNSKLVENFPVSMGKEAKGRWTHSGIHIVNARNAVKHMDSSTFGLALDAGGYKATVRWATRISDNGEFVHSAPWSVKQQGKSNTSHGCINLSPKRAKWFYDFSRVGDVVKVIGTPVQLKPSDGDIYDWTISWSAWTR